MKKSLVVSLAVSSFLFADAEYNIFVGSFKPTSENSRIEKFKNKVEATFSNTKNVQSVVNGIFNGSNEYRAVAIRTGNISNADLKALMQDVKAAGYSDAYFVDASKSEFVVEDESKTQPVVETAVVETKEFKEPEPAKEEMPVVAESSNQLTLDQAVKSVLAENPNLRQIDYAYRQVGKDLNIANNAYYPVLDVSGTYGYSAKEEKYKYTNRTDSRNKGDGMKTTASATLVENIYNGGADKNRIISQSHRLDAAAYTVVQRADRLTLSLVDAYLEVIKNKKLLDIAKDNVQIHEEIYFQIKERTDTGFARNSEERQAGSRLTLAQSNLVAQENNYNDALTTFEKIYGKRVDPQDLVTPEFTLALPTSEVAVFDKAMRCNPSVRVEESNVKMAESVANEKNAPFRPKLDLEASANYSKDNVYNEDYNQKNYDVLLRLKYNLYNKGIDKLDKEKSKLAVSESMSAMDVVKRDLSESLKFSWQTYVLDGKKLEYLAKHVDYSRETLDAYRDEFRIGRRDLINLLDAENEYNSALKEQVETEKTFLYAKYRLLDNMGMITDSFEPGFAKRYIQGACSIQEDLK
ncbi:MAG: TolC family outer membrane protein [Campylobacter sp.]